MFRFQHEVEFTKQGTLFDARQADRLLSDVGPITDLWVASHGWNNDSAEARRLYDDLFGSVKQVFDLDVVPGLSGRQFGVVRVLWPSKKFANADLIPGGGAAAMNPVDNQTALLHLLEQLKHSPERLDEDRLDPVSEAAMTRAQQLVPQLDHDEGARREYVLQLRSILDPAAAHSEDGSEDFFTRDPLELFEELREPVSAPGGSGGGGALGLGGGTGAAGAAGGAAGLRDVFSGAQAAARRLANYATYYQMKDRAGQVGSRGVAQLLGQIRQRNSAVRLHLVGHSFGGRLVTAAAHALPPATPAVTMVLLQAAYSHNGLARRFDGKNDGFYRSVITSQRISGPIAITHTKNDEAVGVAYPLASRVARQKASAIGDENDPYGGMGRNGAQHTPEVDLATKVLLDLGHSYTFQPGAVYNLRADKFIGDHGAVTGPQVAQVLLRIAAAV